MVYTDDHRPMHVHIWHQGNEAVLEIETEVRIRENNGMTRTHLRRAVRLIEDNLELLRREWRRIHER